MIHKIVTRKIVINQEKKILKKFDFDNLKYFKLIGNTGTFEIFVQKFISLYGFNLHSYTHQKIANYDRNFIDLMIKKLYQKIIDYNFYDVLLMREIEKINNKL